MHIYNYDVIVFDCDGVIFDSNNLKIDAMEIALEGYSDDEVSQCLNYFSQNFGKSRYYHINYFFEHFLSFRLEKKNELIKDVLDCYSAACVDLYSKSNFCDNILHLLHALKDRNKRLYVASGSDQNELVSVFSGRNLTTFFDKIYGSPLPKESAIREIVDCNYGKKILMVGDSKADLLAANSLSIDFLFYKKYSLSLKQMEQLKKTHNFECIAEFMEVI